MLDQISPHHLVIVSSCILDTSAAANDRHKQGPSTHVQKNLGQPHAEQQMRQALACRFEKLRGVEAKLRRLKGNPTKADVLSSCRKPYARMPHPPAGYEGCTGAGNSSEADASGDDEEYNPKADTGNLASYSKRRKPRKWGLLQSPQPEKLCSPWLGPYESIAAGLCIPSHADTPPLSCEHPKEMYSKFCRHCPCIQQFCTVLCSAWVSLPPGLMHQINVDAFACRRPVASSVPCTARGGHVTTRAPSLEAQGTDRLQRDHSEQTHAQVRSRIGTGT